jgi:hypothetical protein
MIQQIMDVHDIEEQASESSAVYRSSETVSLCLSWVRKISRRTGVLPSSLVLREVKQVDKHPVRCGGLADIFRGSYDGKPIAVKVIRVTTTTALMNQTHRVSDGLPTLCHF